MGKQVSRILIGKVCLSPLRFLSPTDPHREPTEETFFSVAKICRSPLLIIHRCKVWLLRVNVTTIRHVIARAAESVDFAWKLNVAAVPNYVRMYCPSTALQAGSS